MNKPPTWTIHQGDALTMLRTLSSESVHCVVTSPPYWGLRDYGTGAWIGGNPDCQHTSIRKSPESDVKNKQGTNAGSSRDPIRSDCRLCGAMREDNQIGLEQTPDEYVLKMVDVFAEVRRVLRKDGTLWLNLGDSYGSGPGRNDTNRAGVDGFTGSQGKYGTQQIAKSHVAITTNLKPKDLVGIPWMVAFALRSDGWYLRSDIIWSKPNPMPESVTDRPTKSHEYLFLLTKSERYYFDQEAVREPATSTDDSLRDRDNTKLNNTPGRTRMGGLTTNGYHVRNVRSVWNIATEPFPEAHFATFPQKLVRRCLLAGVSERGVCANCGSPWKRIIEIEDPEERLGKSYHDHVNDLGVGQRGVPPASGAPIKQTVGWEPPCKCDALTVAATVLDLFSGSGTTGVVATKMGYNYIGIELNPEYIAMSERRLETVNQQHGVFV